MRGALLALLVGSWGCNHLLGIDDSCIDECVCRIDQDCGPNAFCNDQVSSSSCECVAGYAPGPGGCEWSGVIADPGFTGASAWSALNLATIDGAALDPAMNDRGFGRLPGGSCDAVLQQRIEMPRYSRSGPLVARVSYRVPDPVGASGAPALGVETAWTEVRDPNFPGTGWTTVRRCLGGGHYAAETSVGRGEEVVLAVGRMDFGCQHESVDVDRFEVIPALDGECPVPGQVVNGLADLEGGWTFAANDGALAGFVAGVGENGSRAGKLVLEQRCSSASAQVPVSPGLVDETGSPSLSYYVSSAGTTAVFGSFDRYALPTLTTNPAAIIRFCVPAHLRGTASRLEIQPLFTGTTGACADPITSSAVLDTVKLESVPECGTNPSIADPGFEAGSLLDASISGTGSAQSVADAGSHSGARMLELKMSSCGSSAFARVHVIAPPRVATGGPALRFWSRMTAGTRSTLGVIRTGTNVTIARDQQWRQSRLCLDPKLSGRDQEVQFFLSASCTGTFPAESAFIDDLTVITDPSCPPT